MFKNAFTGFANEIGIEVTVTGLCVIMNGQNRFCKQTVHKIIEVSK